MRISELRKEYHRRICNEVIRIRRDKTKGIDYPKKD